MMPPAWASRASAADRPGRPIAAEPLWLEWLALAGLLAFATWLLGTRGVWALLLSADPTGIALVICIVFTASTLWCGARARELQRRRDDWAAEYVRALAGDIASTAEIIVNVSSPSTGFFPLESGHRRTCDVKTEEDNNVVEHEDLVLSTHGSDSSVEGGAALRRLSDSGVDYWLRRDDSGVYRVASKSDLDAEPKLDAQRRNALKAPLAAGSS